MKNSTESPRPFSRLTRAWGCCMFHQTRPKPAPGWHGRSNSPPHVAAPVLVTVAAIGLAKAAIQPAAKVDGRHALATVATIGSHVGATARTIGVVVVAPPLARA